MTAPDDSAIARLISDTGCDCDADADGPHTCPAGRAEAEWRALLAELERLRAEVVKLDKECELIAVERNGARHRAAAAEARAGRRPGANVETPDFGAARKAIGCRTGGDGCGFVSTGLGYTCTEGAACGRYVHPGDPGFAELRAYYDAAAEDRR